ncbi:MAG: type II toxin-antitoxin system HicA family toxin [Planctomycetes bacterium]|nr:type II toxin-antitoxin system HicA family toxin [Planctomycetota bacterium]
MKSISGKKLCKVLEKHGWILKRVRGSHHILAREGTDVIITVPVHGNKDLRIGTLRKILGDAALSEDDL